LVALGESAAPQSKFGGHEHSVGDRLAVAVPLVLGYGFDRMAGGMAKVQNAPRPRLALVGGDDRGLDTARFGDDRRERRGIARENRGAIAGDAIEEPGAG